MPFLQVEDVRLYYEWHGPEEAPPLVLVNGLLTDTSSWAPTVQALEHRYRILTYDCRGQGRSDKPPHPYPPSLHAHDLEGMLQALGLAAYGVHAIGLSSGGCVLLDLAARRPSWFRSLVIVDAYARVDNALKARLQGWVAAMEVGGGPLRFDVATPWVWGRTFLNQNYEALRPFRDKAVGIPQEPAINLIKGAMNHDVLANLWRITCPTLAVVGEEDVLTPRPYAEEIAGGVAGARLEVLAGAGHASLLEKPEEFNRLALRFLEGAVSGRAGEGGAA